MKKNALTRVVMILAQLDVVFGSFGVVSHAGACTPNPVDPIPAAMPVMRASRSPAGRF